ncbi:MAG TPA: hypothetical protein VF827_10500, partial [Syntrophales bacterium]
LHDPPSRCGELNPQGLTFSAAAIGLCQKRQSGGCRLDSLTNTPVRVNKTLRASASAEHYLFHKFSNESASVKC